MTVLYIQENTAKTVLRVRGDLVTAAVGNHFADKDQSRRRNHDHALAVAIAMRQEKADR